jgi:TolB-like protein/class 3 adenylate cyclase
LERRLAAILAADVVGYSRLMGEDEAGTLATLKAHRESFIDPTIAQHNGRLVKLMGDGGLVEFASAVDAVECAVVLQAGMTARNANVSKDQQIIFRIGINIGDLIVEGDDLYGDGVNIAARLEGLAEPGGICVSRNVVNQVKGKVAFGFADLGEQTVKNIAEPVHAYRVVCGLSGTKTAPRPAPTKRKRLYGVVGIAVALAVLAGIALWQFTAVPDVEPASIEAMALPLPDTPSIAVLPFANTSGDPTQEYFADGITDDLTTDLAKLPSLFVISRNSAFTYKGKAIKIRDVAQDLGVRYVLEGNVRRVGEQVRINAQLTDALSGGHVWADRYDRQVINIFDVQDAIAASVVQALGLQLTDPSQDIQLVKPATDSIEAYDLVLRARKLLTRFDRKSALEARDLLEQALALDPHYVEASTLLGLFYFDEWRLWGRKRDENLARALKLGKAAAELEPDDPAPHVLLALVYQFRREFELANQEADRALVLKPKDAVSLANLGSMMRWADRGEDAVEVIERAIRLDPFHPPNYLEWLSDAYSLVGRYEDCIEVLERGLKLDPDFVALHVNAAQCYGPLGDEERLREAGANILKANPRFTIRGYRSYVPYTNQDDLKRNVEWLRAAGVPE